MSDDIRKKLVSRMEQENIRQTHLAEILKISSRTIMRFINGESVSRKTLVKFENYINDAKSHYRNVEMVNIGQIKVDRDIYDYIKRYADGESVEMTTVVRKILRDATDNDYLWKSMTDHLMMTERAIKNVIQAILIPFLRTQDKVLENIELQSNWLEEMIGRFMLENYTDPQAQTRYAEIKEEYFMNVLDKKYGHNND